MKAGIKTIVIFIDYIFLFIGWNALLLWVRSHWTNNISTGDLIYRQHYLQEFKVNIIIVCININYCKLARDCECKYTMYLPDYV